MGWGLRERFNKTPTRVLLVDHGSLYPALQRLEHQGWITAKWGISANNRKARFYELSPSGREQLARETNQWRKLVSAIGRVLGPEEAEG